MRRSFHISHFLRIDLFLIPKQKEKKKIIYLHQTYEAILHILFTFYSRWDEFEEGKKNGLPERYIWGLRTDYKTKALLSTFFGGTLYRPLCIAIGISECYFVLGKNADRFSLPSRILDGRRSLEKLEEYNTNRFQMYIVCTLKIPALTDETYQTNPPHNLLNVFCFFFFPLVFYHLFQSSNAFLF